MAKSIKMFAAALFAAMLTLFIATPLTAYAADGSSGGGI